MPSGIKDNSVDACSTRFTFPEYQDHRIRTTMIIRGDRPVGQYVIPVTGQKPDFEVVEAIGCESWHIRQALPDVFSPSIALKCLFVNYS